MDTTTLHSRRRSTRRSSPSERRRESRESTRIEGLIGPRRATKEQCEVATIEQLGNKGVRIRSSHPLSIDEPVCVYVEGESRPIDARVVWVRREGLLYRRITGKPAPGFVAGCRVEDTPAVSLAFRKLHRSAMQTASDHLPVYLGKAVVTAGIAGFVALAAYFLATVLPLIH